MNLEPSFGRMAVGRPCTRSISPLPWLARSPPSSRAAVTPPPRRGSPSAQTEGIVDQNSGHVIFQRPSLGQCQSLDMIANNPRIGHVYMMLNNVPVSRVVADSALQRASSLSAERCRPMPQSPVHFGSCELPTSRRCSVPSRGNTPELRSPSRHSVGSFWTPGGSIPPTTLGAQNYISRRSLGGSASLAPYEPMHKRWESPSGKGPVALPQTVVTGGSCELTKTEAQSIVGVNVTGRPNSATTNRAMTPPRPGVSVASWSLGDGSLSSSASFVASPHVTSVPSRTPRNSTASSMASCPPERAKSCSSWLSQAVSTPIKGTSIKNIAALLTSTGSSSQQVFGRGTCVHSLAWPCSPATPPASLQLHSPPPRTLQSTRSASPQMTRQVAWNRLPGLCVDSHFASLGGMATQVAYEDVGSSSSACFGKLCPRTSAKATCRPSSPTPIRKFQALSAVVARHMSPSKPPLPVEICEGIPKQHLARTVSPQLLRPFSELSSMRRRSSRLSKAYSFTRGNETEEANTVAKSADLSTSGCQCTAKVGTTADLEEVSVVERGAKTVPYADAGATTCDESVDDLQESTVEVGSSRHASSQEQLLHVDGCATIGNGNHDNRECQPALDVDSYIDHKASDLGLGSPASHTTPNVHFAPRAESVSNDAVAKQFRFGYDWREASRETEQEELVAEDAFFDSVNLFQNEAVPANSSSQATVPDRGVSSRRPSRDSVVSSGTKSSGQNSTLYTAAMSALVPREEAKHPVRAGVGSILLEHCKNVVNGKQSECDNDISVVSSLFFDSMPKSSITIERIEQIVKPQFLRRFLKKVAEERACVEATFHGTKAESAQQIASEGLRADACQVGAYGLGAYVGTHAGIAHQYASPDVEGRRRMCVVLAVIGSRVVKGHQGRRARVTALDRLLNPTQYCFVDEHRLLASHMVTYQVNACSEPRRIGGGWRDPFEATLSRAVRRGASRERKMGWR
eukprot:TRINITY_DN31318_c0_g1_i1.p1 TRINITY_DN31318_c0_g1~~TRINITY_DN31318_c0_g1_i1.p1  ORF type:complete len:971 (-),score=98.09 TRINITY_DN31318_c0_g1_i1:152-3064(-)